MKEDKLLTSNITGLTEEQKDQLKNSEFLTIDDVVFIRKDKAIDIANRSHNKNLERLKSDFKIQAGKGMIV